MKITEGLQIIYQRLNSTDDELNVNNDLRIYFIKIRDKELTQVYWTRTHPECCR